MTQSELTDRLRRVERETIHDGKCYAEITEITDTHDGEISLALELPTGRVVSESFEMPQTASTDYAFVRFLRSNGLTLGETDRLVGKEVPVEVEATTATLDVPEPDRTVWGELTARWSSLRSTIRQPKQKWKFWAGFGLAIYSLIVAFNTIVNNPEPSAFPVILFFASTIVLVNAILWMLVSG